MKLALRIASTAIVAAGAALTVYVATPVLHASVTSAEALPTLGAPEATALATAAATAAATAGATAVSNGTLGTSLVGSLGGSLGGSLSGAFDSPVARIALWSSEPAPAPVRNRVTNTRDDDAAWRRPSWFPAVNDLDTVALMGPALGSALSGPALSKAELLGSQASLALSKRAPSLRSRSVFVFDVDAGRALLEKNADVVRPVASLTKLVSSLALMSADPDLDSEFCVTAAQYPTRSGARSRLSTGDCLGGWDVLGAALVASDNRAAYALATVSGLDMDSFIARMDSVSADLGMDHSTWSDPSGLEDENLSTARDMARATLAVAAHPVLSTVSTAPFWDLYRSNKNAPRRLFTTDRLVGRTDLQVLSAKTGYTDTARYCFSTMVQTDDGRRLVITLLGADGKLSRWADVDRILRWVASEEA